MDDAKAPSHTPGPWTIEDEGVDFDVRLELKGDFGSKPIAELYTRYHSPFHEYDSEEEEFADYAEYEANHFLIAAAPELLGKCREYSLACSERIKAIQDEVRPCCECDDKEDHDKCSDAGQQIDHWQAAKHMVDAVIRKAEGLYE